MFKSELVLIFHFFTAMALIMIIVPGSGDFVGSGGGWWASLSIPMLSCFLKCPRSLINTGFFLSCIRITLRLITGYNYTCLLIAVTVFLLNRIFFRILWLITIPSNKLVLDMFFFNFHLYIQSNKSTTELLPVCENPKC